MKRVSLPEHSWLDLQVASFGSRLLAYLVDLATRWTASLLVLLLGVYLFLPFFVELAPSALLRSLLDRQSLIAILIVGFFLIETLYPVYFETRRDGQTPGKKLIGLRVVTEDGLPVTFRASFLRALFSLIDAMPAGGGVALGAMLVSRHSQRLGDLVAGTMVIYDHPVGSEATHAFPEDKAPVFIPPALYTQLQSILARKGEISSTYYTKASNALLSRLKSSVDPLTWSNTLEGVSLTEVMPLVRPLAKQYTESGTQPRYDWSGVRRDVKDAEASFDRLEKTKELSFTELQAIATKYQSLCERYASLATFYPDITETKIASATVRRGRALIYGKRQEEEKTLPFLVRVAQGFQACSFHCLFSFLLLTGSAVLTAAAVAIHPDLGWHFIPEATGEQLASGQLWTDGVRGMSSMAASQIMTNNIKVAFAAFGLGIMGGLGTVLVLLFNGAHLGGTFFVLGHYDMAGRLGQFILAHGFLELSIIIVAAGTGLYLGDAIINPGFKTRWRAIQLRARTIFDLLLFSALCLIPAGIVEGYISPYEYPTLLKVALGLFLAIIYWGIITGVRARSSRAV